MRKCPFIKAKPVLFTLIFLFSVVCASAQNQNNIWYFGANGGVDFNQSPVTALTNGKLNTSEACASIADEGGALLFYTDGITVWNRQHAIMENGVGLSGNKSTTQTIIVPCPDNDNLFFIFTAGVIPAEHIDYSVVNLTGDGGFGEITSKNISLLNDNATEKLTAVKHANGKDIWVIGHGTESNEFFAWLITKNGVTATPQKSFAGTAHAGIASKGIGYLKASPDGNTLAVAAEDASGGFVELLTFNTSTGNVTDPNKKLTGFTQSFNPYGLEFSPNGNLLYVTEYKNGSPGKLYQIKLPFVSGLISNSSTVLATLTSVAALQIAPDGKIYLSQSGVGYLHAINFPNLEGTASDFRLNAVSLAGKKANLGLPAFNLSDFSGLSFTSNGTCSAVATQFKLISNTPTFDAITWDFDDPASGADNTSHTRDPSHFFSHAGVFNVTVNTMLNGSPDTKSKSVTILQSPDGALYDVSDMNVLCENGVVNLTAHGATDNEQYNWYDENKGLIIQTADGNYQSKVLDKSTTFYVSITNGSCEGELKQIDVVLDKPIAEITSTNTIIDVGESVVLTANDGAKYEWSPATYLSNTDGKTTTSTPMGNINYTLTVTNFNGCPAQKSITIILKSDLTIPNTFTPNADGINDFWVVKNLDILENFTQVFDRYGALVYTAKNYKNNWNGTKNGQELPAGVYYYVIKLYNNSVMSGNVMILR